MIDAAAVAAGRFADDPEAVARQRGADPAIDHDNPLEEVFSDQLACADLVILNKTDLLDAAALAGLRADIEARLRPGVKLVAAEQGRVPPAVALGLAAAPRTISPRGRRCTSSKASTTTTISTVLSSKPGRSPIRRCSAPGSPPRSATQDVLRVKGFADVPGRDRRLVIQAVGSRIEQHFDRPWAAGEDRATRLVVIGKKGLDRAAVEAALAGRRGG